MMKFLFRKTNIASLVFFRIVFGVLGFLDVMGSWIGKHFIDGTFQPGQFQFKYYGFEWLMTLPDPWLSIIFIISAIAALGIALGKWYRLSATVFAIGFSYIYFLEKAYYLNHGYLTMVIAWWIIFMPLARHYSLDILKKPESARSHVPYWPLFLLQFSMGVVYFYGGIAKLNSDWLNGMPLKLWLKQKASMPILGHLWKQEWMAYFMSYGGLLLDLLVVFFLINKRTRIWALGFVLFFHLNNLIIFKIGIFPFLSVTLTLLYFEPDFPIRAWNWLEQKLSFLESLGKRWQQAFQMGKDQLLEYSIPQQKLIQLIILIFGLVMLTIPFRHHLFEGDVAWNEEGHRYSWRMMLRQKRAYGSFRVVDIQRDSTHRIKPSDHLTKRQKRKMLTHPDMILQFAHYLRDNYREKLGGEVAVYADIRCKLNGGKYQEYVDPEVDLAKEEWSFFKHSEWIIPLKREE